MNHLSQSQADLQAARDRIREAYDPGLLQHAGERLSQQLAAHLERVQNSQGVVLPWVDPRENLRVAQDTLHSTGLGQFGATDPGGKNSAALLDHFGKLVTLALSRGHNLHDPRYVGHQVPPPVPLAGLFDAIGAVTNQPMAIYEMGPWATAIEQALILELARYLGWESRDFGGIVTHGASLANLTALLVARNVVLGDAWERGLWDRQGPAPVLVVQADAHYCIARAAGILGLGTNQIRKAALDAERRLDPAALDRQLTQLRTLGQPVIAVVACACATPTGAFDPLERVADVCEKHAVWLHVDAAHGGAVLLSEQHKHRVRGLERADSLTWDAHKMLFVPALCAFLFYKEKRHSYEAFRQNAPYLFDPSAPGLSDFDGGLRTVECTKRGQAFGLWGLWCLFGPELLADLVNVTFDLARQLYEKLQAADDFEPWYEPQSNIVVFRHLPPELRNAEPAVVSQLQAQLRRSVVESGEYYLVPVTLEGKAGLRCTLMNPLTTSAQLDGLLDTLRQHARRLLPSLLLHQSTPHP